METRESKAIRLLTLAEEWITAELEHIGGCEHDVGICLCPDNKLVDEIHAFLTGNCRQCGKPMTETVEYCHGEGRNP